MIAGCYVVDGILKRDAEVRVVRDGVVIYTGRISSLKRFKDDANEVRAGFECGAGVSNFNDVKVGDILECFSMQKLILARSHRLTAGRVTGEIAAEEAPRMPIGLLTLEIYIPDAHSLKDKRQVLRSLKDRLRARFNVAVAELDHQDTWQRAQVGVVSLSNNAGPSGAIPARRAGRVRADAGARSGRPRSGDVSERRETRRILNP